MQNNKYLNYSEWKNWNNFYTLTLQLKLLYSKQFKGLIFKNKSFLDIGFGDGSLLRWAKDQGALISGIEVQENLIANAKEKKIKTYKTIDDVPENSIDIVTMFDVLEHLTKAEISEYLTRIYKKTRKGGKIFIRVPNCQSPAGIALQFGDHTHVTMLSGQYLQAYLIEAGWTKIHFKGAIYVSPSFIIRLLSYLLKPLSLLFFLIYRFSFQQKGTVLEANLFISAEK